MTKKLIHILLITLLILVGVTIFARFFNGTNENTNEYTDLPENNGSYSDIVPYSEDTGFAILQKKGGYAQVRDFISDEDTYEFTPGTLVLGKAEGLKGTEYEIFYFKEDGSITVSLLTEPLHTIRLLAEKELLESLGVSEETLCSFDVWVSVPREVSEIYSGRNLGLSFCEGSITLD
jgi:hypothetical protein